MLFVKLGKAQNNLIEFVQSVGTFKMQLKTGFRKVKVNKDEVALKWQACETILSKRRSLTSLKCWFKTAFMSNISLSKVNVDKSIANNAKFAVSKYTLFEPWKIRITEGRAFILAYQQI